MSKIIRKAMGIAFVSMVLVSVSFTPALADGDVYVGTAENGMPIHESVEEYADLPQLESTFISETTAEQYSEMEEGNFPLLPERREILPNGRQRVYGTPEMSTKLNNKYEHLGSVQAYNGSSVAGTLSYAQGVTRTSHWNVSANVSGKGEIGVKFLAKFEATLGGSFAKSWTTAKSTTVTYTTPVPPRTTKKIDCYQVGASGSGTIKYWDYAPSGGNPLNSGSLPVSGSAPKKNSYKYYVI